MAFTFTLGSEKYNFDSLKILLAKASPSRSGDDLSGLSASTDRERIAAQLALADLPLKHFLVESVIDYETDEVTRLIVDTHDGEAFELISHFTVGEFRDWLLSFSTTTDRLSAIKNSVTPEMAAAVSKIMRNQDLILVAKKIEVMTKFRNTMGRRGHLGVRLQPNHPTDDLKGILASVFDGLLFGCGDAMIGINPASDSLHKHRELLLMLDELRERFQIPTQICVLTHVTNQLEMIRNLAPVDLVFQSIAGTEAANKSFGIHLELLREANEMAQALRRGTVGQNVMYFETGQGSCLSADAHHGVDQQTLEARAYAVARHYSPFLVNTVVGFIGPEYLFNGKQIIRAGLEDHFCGKLLGLPMGVDVCYTNHVDADQDDMDSLLTQLGVAGCNYIMGVPGADDIMLGYQSTSFHDALYIREVLGLSPAPEFVDWLRQMNIMGDNGRIQDAEVARASLLQAGESYGF